MFEIPSNPKIEKCIITEKTVKEGIQPEVIINENKKVKKAIKKKKSMQANKEETA